MADGSADCSRVVGNGSHSKFHINSFVFLDLETSWLSHLDKPTIIEISLVAVHRKALLLHPLLWSLKESEMMGDSIFIDHTRLMLPRVADKLTMCLDPRKQTSPATYHLTKLDNFNLAESRKGPLNEKVVTMLKLFLSVQEPPVCLVAHNGNNFDFPLLKTELQRLTSEHLFDGLLCADSIVAFKEDFAVKKERVDNAVCQSSSQKRKASDDISICDDKIGQNTKHETQSDISDRDLQTELLFTSPSDLSILPQEQESNELELGQHPNSTTLSPVLITSGTLSPPSTPPSLSSRDNQKCESVSSNAISLSPPTLLSVPKASSSSSPVSSSAIMSPTCASDEHPFTPSSSSSQTINHCELPATPPRPTIADPVSTPPPSAHQRKRLGQSSFVHRRVTPRVSFSLANIFKRTFGVEPLNSHSAEHDVVSLIKIIFPKAEQFVEWADRNAVEFGNIELYYQPIKPKRKLVFPPDH